MKLTIDEIQGVRSISETVSIEDFTIAIQYLNKLDGIHHTLISLNREDSCTMMIGGGPDKFIVTLDSEDRSFTLINLESDTSGEIEICAGGQLGEYPGEIVSDKISAESAIKYFFDHQEESLDWI